jgi:probable F420-dependent oxidoreductase
MDYGICLPNVTDSASPESIEAAAETAERLGWTSVWTTDHLLVERAQAENYGRVFEAIETLAWVGARHRSLQLGTSVIVVPMRNAVVLAKELATLDALSGGRVIAGVGVGWDQLEFANVGVADRFHVRGAYLDETIRLWRHLWSGSSEPFEGRFTSLSDFVFGPLPAQRSRLPIIVGGRSAAALHRAGALADGYQSTSTAVEDYPVRAKAVREAASAARRPPPMLSARIRIALDKPAEGTAIGGTPESIARTLRGFADAGVESVALYFEEPDAETLVKAIERFDREVRPLVN